MKRDRPSDTAAIVAVARGLGAFLPDRLHLSDDPYGLRFATVGFVSMLRNRPAAERGARATSGLWLRGPLRSFVLYMQARTRVIDDDVCAFVRSGGRQVVLLGAGFDTRAWRLAALGGARVFEVDHPATQAKKRAVMAGEQPYARVEYVTWDFERERLDGLGMRLVAHGHDPRAPTMTILEGVLMYLSPAAIDATFACIGGYSPATSPLALTYMETALIAGRTADAGFRRRVAGLVGEPFRTGFEPATFPAWLGARGFVLQRDEAADGATGRLIAGGRALATGADCTRSHFALAVRS